MASPLIAGVLHTLTPAEPVFEIGEPLWLTIHVENRSDHLIVGWVDMGADSRTAALHASVTGADGRNAPDPEPWRFRRTGPGIKRLTALDVEVAPGDSADLRVDLARHAWLDEPGTYAITLLAPFAPLPENGQPPPASDARWLHAELTLVRPRDPAAIVGAYPPTVVEGGTLSEASTPEALGHAMYVPILERFGDGRAVYGLGACPCPEATQALFALYDRANNAQLRDAVRFELQRRIPPLTNASWRSVRAWEPRFDAFALERGRAALAGSTHVPDWARSYLWGLDIVTRFGDGTDGPLLYAALDRAEHGDGRGDKYHPGDLVIVRKLREAAARLSAPSSSDLHRAFASDEPADAMRGLLFEQLATAEPWSVSWLLLELRRYVPRDEWVNLTLTKLSADPTNLDLVDVLLLEVTGCTERSRGAVLPGEIPAMVVAWMAHLRLGAESLTIEPGITDSALVPASFVCSLPSGQMWPDRSGSSATPAAGGAE